MRVRTLLATLLTCGLVLGGCSNNNKKEPASAKSAADETEPAAAAVVTTVTKVTKPKPMPAFVTFDADGDKEVTKEEFQAALTEYPIFSDWDGDGDGELTDVEFENSLYKAWDLNGDQKVDLYEYKDGSGAYFPHATAYGSFEDYDGDGDKELMMDEYAGLAGKVYDDWDGDGNGELTDLEFQTALYNAWDLNGDGVVDHYEFRWN